MSTRERVLQILKDVKPTKNLENISNIIEGGYIDSFELMMLITALSEKFAVEITVGEMIPENFNSVGAISRMVDALLEKKQKLVK